MLKFSKHLIAPSVLLIGFSVNSNNHPSDTADLDDIKLYDIVKVEQCLDAAYDRIQGHARKLEFKI